MNRNERGMSWILIILLIFILLLLGLYLYKTYSSSNPVNRPEDKVSQTKESGENDCALYLTTEVSYTTLLEPYTVKSGDTLITIANDILENPSAVGKLIKINSEIYPGLSIVNPFIEVGWEIYLPNEELDAKGYESIIKSSGNLSTNEHGFRVVEPKGGIGPLESNSDVEESLKNINEGDCVHVVFGVTSGFNRYAISVEKQ